MKRAVSVSIGSSKRDKAVEVTLLGEKVLIERRGTDGDMEKAARLYQELDGKVDAFGVGGADLGLTVDTKWYRLHSVSPMVRFVKQTPIVDGSGLKMTLEKRLAPFIDKHLGAEVQPRRTLVTGGVDRWGMSTSFFDAGYETVYADLMFGLGIPIPLRTPGQVKVVAALLLPVVSRLPFSWIYPVGEKQDEWTPKYENWYQWAGVIAGDCHYIKRHIPRQLPGRIICTNTTTADDVERFRSVGIRYLVTTTPRLEGRTFGTNMMEAALIAATGKGRALTVAELEAVIQQIGLEPTLQKLE